MADDFQVKQSSSSSGAYAVTGAALGALGGGFGAHYITKPKYGSYDDIIKEAKDSTDFASKIEKAEGEEKTFLQEAKDMASKEKDAADKWENEFKTYYEANKEGVVETDEYKKLVEARNNAEKALNDKKAELEKAEIPAKEGTLSAKDQKAIDKVKDLISEEKKSIRKYAKELNKGMKEASEDLYKAATKLTELDNEIANLRAEKAKMEVAKRKTLSPTALLADRELNELNAKIDAAAKNRKEIIKGYNEQLKELEEVIRKGVKDDMNFPKGKEGAKQIDAKVKEIKAFILDTVQERTLADAQTKVDVAKIAESKTNAVKDIKELTKNSKGFAGIDVAGKTAAEVEKDAGKFVTVQKKQLEKIESFKELYKQAEAKAKASGGKTSVVEEYKMMLGSWETPVTIKKTVTTSGEEAKKFVDTLTKDELATFNRLVSGGDEEAINKAIKARKDKIASLEKAINEIKVADAKVKELGGEGAYIEKGILYDAEGKKVDLKPKEIKIAEGIKTPKTAKLRSLEEQLKKLEEKAGITEARKYTETEIKEKLADETKAFEDANKAVEEAKKGLKKGEAKTEAQCLEEFAKEKGVKDKAEFISKEVESSKKTFIEKSKKWIERKYGFAEHTNWKLAVTAAAGALVLGGIFSAFAPKDRA